MCAHAIFVSMLKDNSGVLLFHIYVFGHYLEMTYITADQFPKFHISVHNNAGMKLVWDK